MVDSGRVAALDGLRAVAILAVLANHTGIPLARGGYLGVDVFFVLSGYLITGILMREREREGKVGLGSFYARRALRLFPALIGAVALGWILDLTGLVDYERFGRHALVAMLYVQDLANAFGFGPALGPLNHTWSLAIEEHFYLLWPLLLSAAMTVGVFTGRRRRAVLLVSVVLGAASFAIMQMLFEPSASPTSTVYYHPEARAAALLVGCAVAAGTWRRVTPSVTAMALAALACVLVASPQANTRVVFAVLMPMVWALTAIVILGVSEHRSVAVNVLSWPPAVFLGTISYGLYLYHPLVFDVLRAHEIGSRSAQAVLGAGMSVLIATLSFRLLETPFLRLKEKFHRQLEPATARRP